MKLIRKIFISLFLLMFIVSGSLFFNGYRIAAEVMTQQSPETLISEIMDSDRYVPFDEIDSDFVNAVVSIEDKRFFSRKGFDYIAIIRAFYNNIKYKGKIEGGSTITQQMAKNLYFQTTKRRLSEKIAEVCVMYYLEEKYSKEDIFAVYSSMNYYGDGYWGLKQAADGYYNKIPSDLTIAEAAMLAGIPNSPSNYQLSTGFESANKRQKKILKNMLKLGYISEAEYEEAIRNDVSAR